jgi:hypothetical protein
MELRSLSPVLGRPWEGAVPYEVAFSKKLSPEHLDAYINECCWGGDLVSAQLLPTVRQRYGKLQANQEDWGWFIWFREGRVALAIDVFCDDPETGTFRIHLTSRRKRWLVFDSVDDCPELEELRQTVVPLLDSWVGVPCRVTTLDNRHMPRTARESTEVV